MSITLKLLLNNRVSNQNENRGLDLGFFVYHFEVRSLFVTDILLSYVWLFALFAFCTLLLASCSGVSYCDNDVYLFEPISDAILEMVEKEGGQIVELVFSLIE